MSQIYPLFQLFGYKLERICFDKQNNLQESLNKTRKQFHKLGFLQANQPTRKFEQYKKTVNQI